MGGGVLAGGLRVRIPPLLLTYFQVSIGNKKRYCDLHGYKLLDGTGWYGGGERPRGKGLAYYSWRKVQFVCEMLERSHHTHWLFWMDTDALFMNMQIKLSQLLAGVTEDDVIIIAPDAEGLNAGTFFIRNNKQGRKFCLGWLEKHHWFRYEQQALSTMYNEAVRRSGQDCHVSEPDDLGHPSGVKACLDRKARHFRVLKLCAMGSWGGLEWRRWHGYYFQGFYMYGDFIVHFAGDRKYKLPMMRLAEEGGL